MRKIYGKSYTRLRMLKTARTVLSMLLVLALCGWGAPGLTSAWAEALSQDADGASTGVQESADSAESAESEADADADGNVDSKDDSQTRKASKRAPLRASSAKPIQYKQGSNGTVTEYATFKEAVDAYNKYNTNSNVDTATAYITFRE